MRDIQSTLIVVLILFSILGCQNTTNSPSKESENSVITSPEISYSQEYKDISAKIESDQDSFLTTLPSNYQLSLTADYLTDKEGVNRIGYEIFIDHPEQDMDDVNVSFHLNPDMMSILDTSSIFNTNILFDEPVRVTTDGNHNGLSFGRAFVLRNDQQGSQDNTMNFKDIFKDIYIKISYTSNHRRLTEYYHLQAELSDRLKSYLESVQ